MIFSIKKINERGEEDVSDCHHTCFSYAVDIPQITDIFQNTFYQYICIKMPPYIFKIKAHFLFVYFEMFVPRIHYKTLGSPVLDSGPVKNTSISMWQDTYIKMCLTNLEAMETFLNKIRKYPVRGLILCII